VATYETSAYDQDGRLRPELALRSLGAKRVLSRRSGPPAVDPSKPGGTYRPLRSAYLRITRRDDLPGHDDTDFVMLDRAFLTVEARDGAEGSLTLIPASRYGPPEKIYIEQETDHPGRLAAAHGQGKTVYFPWPVDLLYFHHSLPEHRDLLVRAVEEVAGGLQATTEAPPQVEVVLSKRPDGAYVVHLINHSGHQDRAYNDALPIYDVSMSLDLGGSKASSARALAEGQDLPLQAGSDGRVQFTLPRLNDFEAIVLTA
jgi:hypothetical protein